MTDYKDTPANKIRPTIKFIDFWQAIAIELGTSRLKLNKNAKTIQQLCTQDSDARFYLKDTIKNSYKLSHCQHLSSPISIDAVLDSLGQSASKLRDKKADDLFDIELLEEIAWHISQHYAHHLSMPKHGLVKKTLANKRAAVISLPARKIRKENQKL